MPFVTARPLEDMLDEDAAPRASRRIASDGGEELAARTRALTPVGSTIDPNRRGRVPGTARESVHAEIVEAIESYRGRGYRRRVVTYDSVFPFIEWDTKPHIIRPRRDRAPATVIATRRPRGTVQDGRAALSWIGFGGGRVYAKVVHHPGTRGAHPFALAALELSNTVELHRIAGPAVREFEHELVHGWLLPATSAHLGRG